MVWVSLGSFQGGARGRSKKFALWVNAVGGVGFISAFEGRVGGALGLGGGR